MSSQRLEIPSADGSPLVAYLFEITSPTPVPGTKMDPVPGTEMDPVPGTNDPAPGAETDPVPGTKMDPVPGTVLINGATGVPQRYYRRFAMYLAKFGLRVMTYDYRGIGESRQGSLRGTSTSMSDWGADFEAVARALDRRFPGTPRFLIGHSFGGQALGLSAVSRDFDGIFLVAAQSGYWKHWPGAGAARMFGLWHVAIPVATAVFGRLPGFLGIGEDLPAEVAREWARWGRNSEYVTGVHPAALENFSAIRCPVRTYAISDDDYAPGASVAALAAWLENAEVCLETLHPQTYGRKHIGHFGFFRQSAEDDLWPLALTFLTALTRTRRAPED